MLRLDLISSECLDSKAMGDVCSGEQSWCPCGVFQWIWDSQEASWGYLCFVLHDSPHGLLLLAPQPHKDQGLGFLLVLPFPLTNLPRNVYSHASCRGWKKRSSHGLWPSEQLQTGETGLIQAVFSEQCPPAVPLPPLSLLSPNCLLLAFVSWTCCYACSMWKELQRI